MSREESQAWWRVQYYADRAKSKDRIEAIRRTLKIQHAFKPLLIATRDCQPVVK